MNYALHMFPFPEIFFVGKIRTLFEAVSVIEMSSLVIGSELTFGLEKKVK